MKRNIKEVKIASILSKAKGLLEMMYGERLKGIILYGSHARGTPSKDSDIDLAVILTGKVDKIQESDKMTDALYDLSLETGELISVNPISEEEIKNGVWPLYYFIQTEGIAI